MAKFSLIFSQISKYQPKQMFMISGSFGGIETRVEVAGWGATTRRGGRYFSSSTFSFLSSPFLSSISSLPVHLSLSFSFSTFSSLYTSCLRPCLHLTPFHCPYECVTYSLSVSFVSFFVFLLVFVLIHTKLKWAPCRAANILQWLEVPPVAADRCVITLHPNTINLSHLHKHCQRNNKPMVLTQYQITGARISMLPEEEAWQTNRFVQGVNLERWLIILIMIMMMIEMMMTLLIKYIETPCEALPTRLSQLQTSIIIWIVSIRSPPDL